jgi:hypothetical protein
LETPATEPPAPASGEITRIEPGVVSPMTGDIGEQLAAQQTEPDTARTETAAALRQPPVEADDPGEQTGDRSERAEATIAPRQPAVTPLETPAADQPAPASGEIPRIAPGVVSPMTGDIGEQLAAQQTEPDTARRETAAALRQSVADDFGTVGTDELSAADEDGPVGPGETTSRQPVSEERANETASATPGEAERRSLRPPLAATTGTGISETTPVPDRPDREFLSPVAAEANAGSGAAQLNPRPQDTTEPHQVAAALRAQAKAETLVADEAAGAPAPARAASIPTEQKESSGSELKAAALAAAGATVAQAGRDVAPGGGSSGVAAALRRGRVDDDEAAVRKAKKARKKAETGDGNNAEAKVEPPVDESDAAGETVDLERAGGRVVSLLPHHQSRPDGAPQPATRDQNETPADPDRAEIEADAAVVRAERRARKATKGRNRPVKQQKVNDPKREPASKAAETPRPERSTADRRAPDSQPRRSKTNARPARSKREETE